MKIKHRLKTRIVWACCILLISAYFSGKVLFLLKNSSSCSCHDRGKQEVMGFGKIFPFINRKLNFTERMVVNRNKCLKKVKKAHVEFFKGLQFSTYKQPRFLHVDPSYHGNFGDTMLTKSLVSLIHKTLHFIEPFSCGYAQSSWGVVPIKNCDEVIPTVYAHTNQKIALWQAGGNWGDLYEGIQIWRMLSMESLLENNFSIVSMPQSIHYKNDSHKSWHTSMIRNKIASGLGIIQKGSSTTSEVLLSPKYKKMVQSRVTFTWRERESYEEALNLYPYVSNRLLPDLAFGLWEYSTIPNYYESSVDLLFFLRNDAESTHSTKRNHNYVRKLLESATSRRTTFRIVDWGHRSSVSNSTDILEIDSAVRLVSLGKIVIVDRLHGSIFSYLSGRPFIYIDQITGKITKALNVAFPESKSGPDSCDNGKNSGWSKADSLEDAVRQAVNFMEEVYSAQ